jgi:hypothetical protein
MAVCVALAPCPGAGAGSARPAAPAPGDSASWAAVGRGAEAAYATVWSARGVAGCRGIRGGLSSRPEVDARAVLGEAALEAGVAGRGAPVRARVCFLSAGRAAAPDAPYDASACGLLAEAGGRTAVILPGEARTASYAWARARRLLGRSSGAGRAFAPRARIFDARCVDLDSVALSLWLGKEAAP